MERDSGSPTYHLNLYALDSDGREILMTHDHILARADGGKNHLSNTQTMCAPCNFKKGSIAHDGGSVFSIGAMERLIRSTYEPLKKNARNLMRLMEGDAAMLVAFQSFLLSMNKVQGKTIKTYALNDVPEGIELEDFDTHHKTFIPIGEKIVIVVCESGFYIYRRDTRERLHISVGKDLS
jgi:hypothetical protein